jgi:uncharacterized protein (UPF0335 family)
MKNFKELQEKLDKYLKLVAEEEIRELILIIINWEDEKADIMREIEAIKKALKTHTHSEGVVYVKY